MSSSTYLPDPYVRIGGRKFWQRRAIRDYLAAVAGQPPPAPQPDDEHLIGSTELRRLLGGVSDMFLHRHSRPRVTQQPDDSPTPPHLSAPAPNRGDEPLVPAMS